ncbi:MAG: methyltransferase [Sedimenticola sp.]
MSTFHFQQFSVIQQLSGMKICTDATLFGAMAPISGGERVLDIGTGTGLLSLMAAQLGAGSITGIEITAEAHSEAVSNFSASPWAERLQAVKGDVRNFAPTADSKYDLIICNPPFFEEHLKATAALRSTARHSDHLPFPDLITVVENLLSDEGLFYLLLPVHGVERLCRLAEVKGIYLVDRTDIRGYRRNSAKVSALTFRRKPNAFVSRLLTIYCSEREYSDESRGYLIDFLLRFRK